MPVATNDPQAEPFRLIQIHGPYFEEPTDRQGAGTASGGEGTTGGKGAPTRTRGQSLTDQEESRYREIIEVADRLHLPPRKAGNIQTIANAAKADPQVVKNALKWGRKNGLI
jgi:hypothetical protein